jgi:hypothetical protein
MALVFLAADLFVNLSGLAFHAGLLPAMPDALDRIVPPAGPVTIYVGQLITTLLGATLLLRGRDIRAAVLLGLMMLMLATAGSTAPWVPNIAATMVLQTLGGQVSLVGLALLWPFFALEVSDASRDARQTRIVWRFAIGLALIFCAVFPIFALLNAALLPPSVEDLLRPLTAQLYIVSVIASQLSGCVIIARNYRRNDTQTRNRIKIVVLALVCFMIWSPVSAALAQTRSWIAIGLGLPFLMAPALLAYAVLRQKLFDLNFALNRTLVYGAVSIILIAAFGLAKWGIEHLIPEKWHEGSAFYSAAIALALFMALHPVMSWVEHQVEKLFFHDWHVNEEALRRFVASAAHFEQSPALCRAFADELTRFAKGAAAALYLRQGEDGYVLQAGNLPDAPPAYPLEDPGFALMRAERKPIEPAGTLSALPGALALPMLDQGRLIGFALLGRKEGGADYRPDEVALLGWAAHQIGLDLQAIHAHELEAEVTLLRHKLAWLEDSKDRPVPSAA